ncbi:hypothetical protein PFICI_10041 [Pestalotiopsis fici W106-1]|uniref:Fungal N-terminal domain-containing protein n=1 Tax=Pestalotiopsis fici (strain W106-1 / CGMCC3.15140) TaxID=1229662 RepID=W3WVY2_PESFW|nr:uncharacterized protein PFICI_10041 [Pestalotiopsis fici W106-1]ETS77979.1 hypothetical protein PFICI_10041 [Pestalotiopsis fici W106-1]
MADPISLVGTAVGVASFALQLYFGISTYIERIRCRKEDLESVERRLQSFRVSITAIEAVEQRLHNGVPTITSPTPLAECIEGCKDELVALKSFWEKFNGQGIRTSDLRDRIKEKAREISYPFRREDLSRLEDRLGQATQILNTSLQAIHVDLELSEAQSIDLIRDDTRSIATRIDHVSNTLEMVGQGIGGASGRLDGMSTTLALLSQNYQSTRDASRRIEQGVGALQTHYSALQEVVKMNSEEQMAELRELIHMLRALHSNMLGQQNVSETLVNPYHTVCDGSKFENSEVSQSSGVSMRMQLMPRSKPSSQDRQLRQSDWERVPFCTCAHTHPKWFIWNISKSLWFQGDFQRFRHHQACPMAKVQHLRHQNSSRLRVEMVGIIQSWRTSFALACGFGNGIEIAPSIACVRVVDDKSPLALANHIILHARVCGSIAQTKVYEILFQKLKQLYREGRASLMDVQKNGLSIVDCLVLALSMCVSEDGIMTQVGTVGLMPTSWDVLLMVLWRLENGRTNENADGIVACRRLMKSFSDVGCDIEESSVIHKQQGSGWGLFYEVTAFRYTSNLTEYISSPVQAAIQERDYEKLQEALCKNPAHLKRRLMPLNLGVLAISITWPRGLKLMVNTLKENDMVEDQLFEIAQALSFAAHCYRERLLSEAATKRNIDKPCEHIGCTEVLQPLLDLGIPCDYHTKVDYSMLFWECEYGQKMLLMKLKAQRDELSRLARQHLDPDILSSFRITEHTVLDAEAGHICQQLEAHHVRIPGLLCVPLSWHSVYKELRCEAAPVTLLQAIWDAGFHDLGADDIVSHALCSNPSCMEWFLDHGINLEHTLETSEGSFSVAHLSAAAIAMSLRYTHKAKRNNSGLFEYVSRLRKTDMVDKCGCHCSPAGCSPFKILLHTVLALSEFSWPSEYLSRAETLGILMNTHMGQRGISEGVHVQVIRLFTFEKLGLSHSCCSRVKNDRRRYRSSYGLSSPREEEDAREMMEEDGDLLRQLDELMVEFELEYTRSCESLQEFLEGYWTRRMDGVLNALSKSTMSAQQRSAAEDVGVIWETGKISAKRSTRGPKEDSSLLRLGQFEYWAKTIDGL